MDGRSKRQYYVMEYNGESCDTSDAFEIYKPSPTILL
jgi:hypothetical protein